MPSTSRGPQKILNVMPCCKGAHFKVECGNNRAFFSEDCSKYLGVETLALLRLCRQMLEQSP
jgi:hypothetical protein